MSGHPRQQYGRRSREHAALVCLMAIIACALIGVAYLSASLLPRIVDLLSLRQEENRPGALQTAVQQAIQQRNDLSRACAELHRDSAETEATGDYYGKILQAAKDCGLNIEKVEKATTANMPASRAQELGLTVGGRYSSLIAFLKFIGDFACPVAIREMTIMTADGVSYDLKCDLSITVMIDESAN